MSNRIKRIKQSTVNQSIFDSLKTKAPLILGGALLVGAMSLAGCQKTALRPNETRSQFERYDQARNQHAQPFLEDEFGRRTPNLSERLLERGN